ncbi:MAG: polyphosphate polymerase domain-containing protein [Planctomycetales bacterium]|nr:polyphosphate polymerase domain-containing protein [Planctomycetales bacterium]
MSDRLQAARYEFKYVVDEATAKKVREFVLLYLEPDEFTKGHEGIGYAVHSLYLDSPDLKTWQAVIQGEKNRYKLRLRFYDNTGPVFLEIKRRVNLVILKQRALVPRENVQAILEGAPARRELLLKPNNDKHFKALWNFCDLRDRLHAVPAAYTSYMREGYEKHGDNSVRVTFDRALRAGAYHGSLNIDDLETWSKPDMAGVVLELKFTDRFPEWMHTLVQLYNLTRTGFAKYVKCAADIHQLVYFE